ncbi:ATPase associated with various cellular activities AAA_5 [Catenulispora acidiphila DSM 44928]|uniref:ATPase associated with various cellular activities AAA_5 n=1 Tax=Catenulispora acidiphila (strain DSM 44928 / JCM 14897 / NBRC 102108 / NRRL B-24433 / ID139908) TaxID=479433 RepID=C7Q1Z4_CATAD|nr:AAA family ATPase [Catenulispora acidiphila]ACU75695.1 ATPase associated with various cellular activities AAA_5 [Catenulispora acidiphila DSM 44928]
MTTEAVPAAKTKAVRGQLRAAVATQLATAPDVEHTVTQIAKTLDASGGAVGNALMALAAAGHAQLTSETPRRFRATASTPAAAQFAVLVSTLAAGETATATPAKGPATATVTASTMPTPATAAPALTSVTPSPGPVTKKRVSRSKSKTEPVTAATKAAPPETAVASPKSVLRPNGQAYHLRSLGGHPDVEVLRRLRDAGVPALLYGPPGTGKTSMVEAAFTDLVTVSGDNDTTVADLVGEYTQNPDGTYEFVYGPLVVAMREGRALLIDDATLIPANVLAVLYPALDGRREIYLKAHKNEAVTAAPGFYVIAGHNPGAHGAVLTEALSSRFCFQVEVSSDLELAKDLGIHPKAVTVAKNLRKRLGTGDVSWCPNLRELLGFRTIAEVLGDDVAFANLIGVAPIEDRVAVAEAVAAALGREVNALTLGGRI